jgi:hypothetical protein
MTVTLGFMGALLLAAAAASPAAAELRTASTGRQSEPDATTSAFPGLERVDVRYEDSTGELQLTVVLRSPLVDQTQSSAARSTKVEVRLGNFYEGSRYGSCGAGGVRTFELALGQGQASSASGAVVPLAVSSDRRTVVATFPATSAERERNFICVYADMANALGDIELSRTSLFDGFAGEDGDVGVGASEDLQNEFSYLYNNHVERIGQQIGRVPGATARCTPPRGASIVSCRAKARIRTLPDAPTISLRGARRYTITSAKQLRWQQHMRVGISWRRCPARYSKKLAGHPCHIAMTWPTRTLLTPLVYGALGVQFTN